MCPSNVGARLLFLAGVTLTRNAGSGSVVSKVESFMCFCTTAQVFRQQSMKYDRKSCATFQCRESAGRSERAQLSPQAWNIQQSKCEVMTVVNLTPESGFQFVCWNIRSFVRSPCFGCVILH